MQVNINVYEVGYDIGNDCADWVLAYSRPQAIRFYEDYKSQSDCYCRKVSDKEMKKLMFVVEDDGEIMIERTFETQLKRTIKMGCPVPNLFALGE